MNRAHASWVCALLLTAALVKPALAMKEVFVRSKPHVNVGTYQGDATDLWFHANVGIFGDGDATGIVQVRVASGEMYVFQVVGGRARFGGDAIEEITLVVEQIRPTRAGGPVFIILRPDSTQGDCLIYDILGPDVHIAGEIEEPELHVRRR